VGYGVLGVLSWGSRVTPKFSAPLPAKLRRTPKSYRGARTCSTYSMTRPNLVGLGFHPPPGRTKTLSFLSVCLSVRHAVERQILCAWFCHECVIAQKRFRCRWIGELVCASVFNFEGLEKRLGLGLASSQSPSSLMAKIRRLGLVSISWNCRKVLVSISSLTKNRMSRSRKLRSRLLLCLKKVCTL